MNTFVCLFILLPQIRSENQNKETGEVPPDGITYVALGFDFCQDNLGSVRLLRHIKYPKVSLSSAGF